MSDVLIEIPGYQVHGRLGKGGMAEVYLATQLSLKRKVAIKVLLKADAEFSERFVREGHILASLHHPAIITIYDIGQLSDGRHFIAMEFVAGGDLTQFKGQMLAPARALEILRQLASGLRVVHERGLVHRDIKPANILFRADGSAVISDFGIAKELAVDSELTQFGIAVGSPAYISPEQARGEQIDARCDLYSLGVIWLEMLTGNNPFRGDNYTQTVLKHVQLPVPRLSDGLALYQPLLDALLAKDPAQRLDSAATLLGRLSALVDDDEALEATQLRPALPLDVSQQAAVSRAHASSGTAPQASATAQTPSQQPRSVLGWTLLTLGGGLLIAVLGLLWLRSVKMDQHLAQAETYLALGQLISPKGENAQASFNAVLRLDSDNTAALAGLERVKQARVAELLVLAEQRLSEGQLRTPEQDNAEHYFEQALLLIPEHPEASQGLLRVQQAYIALLLQQGQQRLQQDQLLKPEHDSAVYYFNQVLTQAPDNAPAQSGLQQVAQRYAQKARSAYQQLNFPAALAFIEAGLSVEPLNEDLLRLKREHQSLLKGARAAKQSRQQEARPAPNTAPNASTPESSNPLRRLWNRVFD
ncbi:serine/threonine-protein kinase [Atopomonas sediminilitoris]|uniref:serine/threonine-protein kinase n=1 Tax=Atopomonas sediminilitoris TaxID=2919919 RepID=UPI001F4E15F5|nr:serine/threonine-protein kinase [Atopomonas sediminilitoris]MCJ8168048.1 serine/threonine protein kinase [Atopomonas sediminilitoris]